MLRCRRSGLWQNRCSGSVGSHQVKPEAVGKDEHVDEDKLLDEGELLDKGAGEGEGVYERTRSHCGEG